MANSLKQAFPSPSFFRFTSSKILSVGIKKSAGYSGGIFIKKTLRTKKKNKKVILK